MRGEGSHGLLGVVEEELEETGGQRLGERAAAEAEKPLQRGSVTDGVCQHAQIQFVLPRGGRGRRQHWTLRRCEECAEERLLVALRQVAEVAQKTQNHRQTAV